MGNGLNNLGNVPNRSLEDDALDKLFRTARTRNGWQKKPLPNGILNELYALAKWGPTAANCSPARFIFVQTPEGKERLKRHLSSGNMEKTMAAPCCVIVAHDLRFYDLLPQLFLSRDLRSSFANNETATKEMAFRNSCLQGAYLMVAARALGLDCGPMSGFNAETLDADFFPDGRWKSNFLCNLGYGSDENLFPRNPRLSFEEACIEL